MPAHDLFFRIFDVNLALKCAVPELRALLLAHWGHMVTNETFPDLKFDIFRDDPTARISIYRPSRPVINASDEGEFLYELEAAATVELQQRRSELYFVHAAVAEVGGKAYLFAAESGGGKSTTVWGLLHHGWRYLSDELAPLDLTSMRVYAYKRALCLKQLPPASYPLPDSAVKTSRSLHVPVEQLPLVSPESSCPVAGICFVKYQPDASCPAIRAISAGECVARLYANSLNPLAHANAGLAAAAHIARSIPGFAIDSAELVKTCVLIDSSLR